MDMQRVKSILEDEYGCLALPDMEGPAEMYRIDGGLCYVLAKQFHLPDIRDHEDQERYVADYIAEEMSSVGHRNFAFREFTDSNYLRFGST